MEQSINQYVDTLFMNMENFSQKDGLIGKPVTQGDKTFLPVMSITLGYGGGDTQAKSKQNAANANNSGGGMFGGAVGIGAKLCTDAIIVIDKDNVMMAPVNAQGSSMSQVINKIPQIISSMSPGQMGQGAQGGQSNQAQGSQQSGGNQQSGMQQQSGMSGTGSQSGQNKGMF